MTESSSLPTECDVLVVGAGAGGLTAAISAKKLGAEAVVIEKAGQVGGSTALSGGVLWIPESHLAKGANIKDTREAARTYLKHEIGAFYDVDSVEAFLDAGPRMLEFLERETDVRFALSAYPDYHPDAPGGAQIGRSVTAVPYDARNLGSQLALLRPPLSTMTFIGMMFNSSNADLKHFFKATRSLKSAAYVVKRLANHLVEILRYGRGIQVTSGNALAARLIKSALDLHIPIIPDTKAVALVTEGQRVVGARVQGPSGERVIRARKAVVLACGGFPHDSERVKAVYPHVAQGAAHYSATPSTNTGDGIRLAETVGGVFSNCFPNGAAWMPMSKVPGKIDTFRVFPHLVDRYKPGVIAVNIYGQRFANESNSYHDLGISMAREGSALAWLLCDREAFRKYGLGFAKPPPVPASLYTRSGYLISARTIEALAMAIEVCAATLSQTIVGYNERAVYGEDPAFGRGSTAFNRFLGDADHKPNPNVAPVGDGPYYAVKIYMGDIGTFDGLRTDVNGRVITSGGKAIEGLYAVGSDRASVMGGNYPGAGITLGPIMTFAYLTGKSAAGADQAAPAAMDKAMSA